MRWTCGQASVRIGDMVFYYGPYPHSHWVIDWSGGRIHTNYGWEQGLLLIGGLTCISV